MRELPLIEKSIRNSTMQINLLAEQMEGVSSPSADSDPVKSSGGGREEHLLQLIEEKAFLENQRAFNQRKLDAFYAAWSDLSASEQFILDTFFVHRKRKAHEVVMEKLYVEKSTAYRKKDEALQKLAMLITGGWEIDGNKNP